MNNAITDFGTEIITLLTAFGLLTAGTGVIYRRWVRPFMQKLDAAADVIDAQLTKNGGGSLVDRVSRIDSNHAELAGKIDANQATIASNYESSKEHRELLEANQNMLSQSIAGNHEQAQEHWTAIDTHIEEHDQRLAQVETSLSALSVDSRAYADAVVKASQETRDEALKVAAALHKETLDVAAKLKEDASHE